MLLAKENKNTSLSCTRVRLPPEVISTIAGAKWADYLVAPQDSECVVVQKKEIKSMFFNKKN